MQLPVTSVSGQLPAATNLDPVARTIRRQSAGPGQNLVAGRFERQAIANFRRCSSFLTSRHVREALYSVEGVTTNLPAIRRSLPRSRQPESHVAGEHSRRSAFTRSSFHASNTWLACTCIG